MGNNNSSTVAAAVTPQRSVSTRALRIKLPHHRIDIRSALYALHGCAAVMRPDPETFMPHRPDARSARKSVDDSKLSVIVPHKRDSSFGRPGAYQALRMEDKTRSRSTAPRGDSTPSGALRPRYGARATRYVTPYGCRVAPRAPAVSRAMRLQPPREARGKLRVLGSPQSQIRLSTDGPFARCASRSLIRLPTETLACQRIGQCGLRNRRASTPGLAPCGAVTV